MTTPPKARLFRLSREESLVSKTRDAAAAANPERRVRIEVHKRVNPAPAASATTNTPGDAGMPFATGNTDDGFGDMRFPGAEAAGPAAPAGAEPQGMQEGMQARMAAVRAENLTGRQLRMARRIAAMHEIDVASDFEAVVILRDRGIDPFHRAEVGKILSTEAVRSQREAAPNTPVPVASAGMPMRLPRDGETTAFQGTNLPSREVLTEERRAAEIFRIQRDIAKRRRHRLIMLAARLFVFVVLPTIAAGYYFFNVATPLYATESQFQIQQAEKASSGGLGGLFSGTQLATNPDSVSVQSYLTSRDAMLRLDSDLGFKRAFQDPSIDPILRLAADATNEQAYKVYQNSVKIGYDPTEGVINMEVIAPDPKLSQEFSLALIKYAEGQVDQMTSRLRSDQMEGSIESYQDAERQVLAAQQRVLELQEKLGVLDPVAEGTVVMNQIAELERQLNEKRLELGQLQANANPSQSRVAGVRGDIERLESMLTDTRSRLTDDRTARGSLAAISGQIRIAESDLLTRQELLAAAAAQMETARIEGEQARSAICRCRFHPCHLTKRPIPRRSRTRSLPS
ncbi:capsule biosynthesis protein [Paracoccus sp. DMF-8]|uniref:capsule biosynthesis protein n=1 Tax=Paracoccus sp. DMF-8 TaxID=3019445 RepID=UPI00320472E3